MRPRLGLLIDLIRLRVGFSFSLENKGRIRKTLWLIAIV